LSTRVLPTYHSRIANDLLRAPFGLFDALGHAPDPKGVLADPVIDAEGLLDDGLA